MPSCTRAPPESLMKTNGEPVFSDCCIISATLSQCTSPAEPPATVKSWLARCTSRPSMEAAPGHHAVGRHVFAGHAEQRGAVLRKQPDLLEAVRIDQRVDALARRQLARLHAASRACPRRRRASPRARLLRVLRSSPSDACGSVCSHGLTRRCGISSVSPPSSSRFASLTYSAGATVTLCVLPFSVIDVSDGAPCTCACRFRRRALPAARRRFAFAGSLPRFFGPSVARLEELRRHLREHRVGQHVFVAAVAALQAPARRRATAPTPASAGRRDGM